MKYYTIQELNGVLLIADNESSLTRFYDNVFEFPADYVDGKYIVVDNELVLNPNYEQEQTAKREAKFNKEFFNTSLGYIRRSVTMADGSHKDFLSDLLPTIAMAVNINTPVTVLAYNKPDFTEPVEDWTQYQHVETVTPQFIQECFLQLQNDFLPVNEV